MTVIKSSSPHPETPRSAQRTRSFAPPTIPAKVTNSYRLRMILVPGNQLPWFQVRDQLNSLLRGWSAYFSHGSRRIAYRAINHYVRHSVRRFLVRRHKVPSQGIRRFSFEAVFGELGVQHLR